MSDLQNEKSTTATHGASTGSNQGDVSRRGESALVTDQGRTTIADGVVAKIAGIAAREVVGVYALGSGGTRAVGAVRDRVTGGRPRLAQGVSVEVGERQAAIDLEMKVEYGVAIADLASGVRKSVISAIERSTGLQVTEVNITVNDIHIADEDDDDDDGDESQASRVQ